jgi:hypothetical protein
MSENSHIGHCIHTAGSANVQNMLNMDSNIAYSTNCKHRAAATVCTLKTWFVADTHL